MKKNQTGNVGKGAVAGLVGGLVASFVMNKFQALTSKLSKSDNKPSSQSSEEPANVKAAEEISQSVFEHSLTKREKEPAGEAVHYAMGGTSGLIYGAAAELAPVATIGAGLPFGTAVWLLADEVVVPALKLSKPPTADPLSTHIQALSSHLVYGLTTDLTRRMVRRLLA